MGFAVPGPSLNFGSCDFMYTYEPVTHISSSLVEVLTATAGTSRVTPCRFHSHQ